MSNYLIPDTIYTKYKDYSDEELIGLSAQGDEDARNVILYRYNPIVKRDARLFYLAGGDTEDLIQEGMIALFNAISGYKDDKGAKFSTYATVCIDARIKAAVTRANRNKNKPLNEYVSIDDEADDTIAGCDFSPEQIYLRDEDITDMYRRIDEELSPMERKVALLYIQGLSYADIAAELGKSEKSINNALTRIKNKLR